MVSQEFQASPWKWNFTDLNHTLLQHHTLVLLLILILFSIIFLITFLYFYYHFISLYTHSPNASTSSPSLPPPPPPSQNVGLDSYAINNLPIFLHQSLNTLSNDIVKEISEWSICLGLFEDEEIIRVLLKCQHAYHSGCVDEWLRTRSSCPLCRASLLQVESDTGETTSALHG